MKFSDLNDEQKRWELSSNTEKIFMLLEEIQHLKKIVKNLQSKLEPRKNIS